MAKKPLSYLRFLHAIPNAHSVDIYINNYVLVKNLKYKDFSKYFAGNPGIYNIRVCLSEQSDKPVFEQNVELHKNTIYTCTSIGYPESMTSELIVDQKKDYNKAKTHIRFVNLSPDNSAYDVYVDNNLLIAQLLFREVTGYYEFPAGAHSLQIKNSHTQETVIVHPGANLKAGKLLGGYVVGLENGKPSPEILLPLEGATYLEM